MKLNQVVAIEKGTKEERQRAFTAAYQLFDNDPRFQGLIRTYQPLADGDFVYPAENQRVQVKVNEVFNVVENALTRMWDVVVTKDIGNQNASADIVVDGQTLAENVPVTTMLWLESS